MMELTITEALVLAVGSLGLGMIMLIRGGNWTIDASVYIARHIGISPLVVGFTIIAFGTSLPELIVSINANLSGSPGIAVGNVIGSNIANILLVIGMTATLTTIVAAPRALLRDLMTMLLATAVFAWFLLTGNLGTGVGLGMVAVLLMYACWQYIMARRGKIPLEEIDEPEFPHIKASLIFLLIGLVFVALGAEFLVRGAKISAMAVGIPDAVIGLTVIAIGTSLPELSTCLIAAKKGQSDILLGNIIGSNVFNILMIIGATAAIKPIDVTLIAPQIMVLDIWIMVGISVLFTLLLLFYHKITRPIGILFMSGYSVYILGMYIMNLGG